MKRLTLDIIGLSAWLLTAGPAPLAHAAQPTADTATDMPPQGYVPTARIAIQIAAIVAEPIYGKSVLAHEQPLQARLAGDVWIVTGTLPAGDKGGTLECRISKRTGQILRMIHTL